MVVVRAGAVWVDRRRPGEQPLGAPRVAFLERDDPEQVDRSKILRIGLQNLLIEHAGFIETVLPVQGHALFQGGIGLRRQFFLGHPAL
jgi:hypothetical protein